MYVLRLAVGLGQIGRNKWQSLQQQLLGSRAHIDMRELYEAQEGIRALFHSFSREFAYREIRQGVLSRSTEKKVELTSFIERGHSRLANVNVLLRAFWNEVAHLDAISSSERTIAFNQLTGMLVGESKLRPKLAATLLAAMGYDIIRRASTSPEDVPEALSMDIENLQSSKDELDALGQHAAGAATKLAAALAITDTITSWGDDLSFETGRRGAALQGQLWRDIGTYRSSNRSTVDVQVAGLLTAAQDFINKGPPRQVEYEPGTTELDVMMILLDVVAAGCVYPNITRHCFFSASYLSERFIK